MRCPSRQNAFPCRFMLSAPHAFFPPPLAGRNSGTFRPLRSTCSYPLGAAPQASQRSLYAPNVLPAPLQGFPPCTQASVPTLDPASPRPEGSAGWDTSHLRPISVAAPSPARDGSYFLRKSPPSSPCLCSACFYKRTPGSCQPKGALFFSRFLHNSFQRGAGMKQKPLPVGSAYRLLCVLLKNL